MALYTVQAPDGRIIEIEGPAGASQEQVIMQAQRLLAQQQQQQSQVPDFTAPTTETYDASAEEMLSGVPYTGMPSESGIDQTVGGFMRGAAYDPAAAVAQIVGGQGARERVANIEAAYQEMRKQRGDEGFEFSRLAGNILSPVNIAAGGAGVRAAQMLGRGPFLQAAAGGATAALTQPLSTEPKDLASFISDKAQQIGESALLGIFAQAGITSASKTWQFLRDLTAPLSASGRDRLLREKLNKLSETQRQEIFDALENAEEFVPGSVPTAAEALADVPGGIGLIGLQQRLSRQPDVAPLFAQRQAEQQAARQAQLTFGPETVAELEAQRAAVTAPLREEALTQANIAGQTLPRLQAEETARLAEAESLSRLQAQFTQRAGGQEMISRQDFVPVPGMPRVPSKYQPNYDDNLSRVTEAVQAAKETKNLAAQRRAEADFKRFQANSLADEGFFPLTTDTIVSKIDKILKTPGERSNIAVDTLSSLRAKLLNQADERGVIDSRDLYTIRKEIADDIKSFGEARKTSDFKRLASLETNLKSIIDTEIEKAGGVSWKDYIKNYAEYSQKINRIKIGEDLKQKLGGSVDDVERAGAFKAAVDNAASTIKRASGQSRYTKLSQVLTKEQTEAINSTLADIERKSKAQAAGRKVFSDADLANSPELPQLLERAAVITNVLLRAIKEDANEKLNRKAAELFLNSKQLGIFMSSVPKGKAQQLIDALYSRLTPQNQDLLNRLLIVQPVVSATQQPE